MKTRLIHTKFWKDAYTRSLSKDEKYVYFYLLTNEYVNIIWCYEIDIELIAFDTGMDTPIIEKALQKLEADNKIKRFNGYLFLNNAYKYETYSGAKNDFARMSLEKQMSDEVRDWYLEVVNTPMYTPMYTPYNTETIKHKS